MKKNTILSTILAGSMIIAQTALNKDWHLQKMTFNGVEYSPQNDESIA